MKKLVQKQEDDNEKEVEEKDAKCESQLGQRVAHALDKGCFEEISNRGKLSKLLRFKSKKSETSHISRGKYPDWMSEYQGSIQNMSGDPIGTVKTSPIVQVCKPDLEVLMFDNHQKLADH